MKLEELKKICEIRFKDDKFINHNDIYELLKPFARRYHNDSTGDIVVGDKILFIQDRWSGNFKKPIFLGRVALECEVIKESYGKQSGQHTFTLKNINTNETFSIKGRNLYKYVVLTKNRDNLERAKLLDEKHLRGKRARAKNKTNF